MLDPYISMAESLFKAWQSRKPLLRVALAIAAINLLIVLVLQAIALKPGIDKPLIDTFSATLGILSAAICLVVVAIQNAQESDAWRQKIARVEERALQHPEKPQLAWDLARTKLESYLDRNLAQVRSIYWLTLIVMLFGFGLILYGLYEAFQDPQKLPVSIVGSASGVLVSFIGGSLLVIYRSILAQSKDYVTVLERINAVGMAVQVIGSIPESGEDLRNKTTAELAKQLLSLYGSKPATIRTANARSKEQ